MAPALRIPLSVSTAEFEQQMKKASDVTSQAVKTMRNEFIKLNAQIAIEGVKALAQFGLEVGKLALQLRAMQNALGLLAAGLAIKGVFEAIAAITELARQKIEEFNETAKKASAAGVSTEFFQRWVKGGEAIKLSIDDATAALNRFADAAKDKLGGGGLAKRIEELREAGNLGGNTGVAAFGSAVGNEDKLRAAVDLINQMLDKGERLAALDLAEKAFGTKVADNLRADAGYLDKMLASAQAISATQIVNQEQINTAVDLKNQLDAAQKILAEKWLPLQRDLTGLGFSFQQSTVNLVQSLATAVGYATQLYEAIKQIGAALDIAAKSRFFPNITAAIPLVGPALAAAQATIKAATAGGPELPQDAATRALASGLKNPALVQAGMGQATAIQGLLRGDVSKAPVSTTAAAQDTDFLARQNDQIEKHIALMNADADAVGLGVAKREELRTVALLTAAAERDGVTVTEEMKEAMHVLGEEAGKTALRLAEAQDKMNKLNQASQTLGSAISAAFSDAIIEGKKLDEVLNALLKTLAKAAINASIMSLFTPGAGGGVSPFLSFLGITGKMAGGPVGAGQSYLVGEKGPELFTPGQSGMVVPNSVLARGGGGESQAVVYNINAAGADSGTVVRIQQVLMAHSKAIAGQARMMATTQRLQATGVG